MLYFLLDTIRTSARNQSLFMFLLDTLRTSTRNQSLFMFVLDTIRTSTKNQSLFMFFSVFEIPKLMLMVSRQSSIWYNIIISQGIMGSHDRDRMVVGFTTTYAISA